MTCLTVWSPYVQNIMAKKTDIKTNDCSKILTIEICNGYVSTKLLLLVKDL